MLVSISLLALVPALSAQDPVRAPARSHGLSPSAAELVRAGVDHFGGDPATVATELRQKLERSRTGDAPRYRPRVRELEDGSFVTELVAIEETSLRAKGATPLIRVGLDFGGCDVLATTTTNGLQEALDMAESDSNGPGLTEIRLANSGYYLGRTYDVEGQSVRIEGGYELCDSTTPTGMTTLDADGATDTIFEISGTTMGDPFEVTLRNLDIRNSAGDAEGGGIEIEGDNYVRLFDTFVSSNEATAGGGVHVDGSGASAAFRTRLSARGVSAIAANTSTSNGGGIYCEAEGFVVLGEDVAVATNQADRGGGLYLDGCLGGSVAGGGFAGIFGNEANIHGGGIYLRNAPGYIFSLDHIVGVFDDPPALVHGNTAGSDGGGIYLEGPGAHFDAFNARITENRAMNGNGGGVLVTGDGAILHMSRDAGRACHTADRCSRLSSNHAPAGFGGAASILAGGEAGIVQTYVEGNSAGFGGGAFDVFGDGSLMTAEAIVMASNHSAPSVVNLEGGSNATFEFVTATENDDQSAVFSHSGVDTDLAVHSSIIWEDEGDPFFVTVPDTVVLDCAIVHGSIGLVEGTAVSFVDPDFVDPAGGDYHLSPDSRAVDFCDTAVSAPSVRDVDYQLRGVDAPTTDLLGVYDIGADSNPFPIFRDGFESGDASAWSGRHPI